MITEDTLRNMESMGGSFVKKLASLYRSADVFNKGILHGTFKKYFDEYKK